jgi:protein phosphatase
MTSLFAAMATDPGRVRSSNQDRAIVGNGFLAVADGMGGHVGGETAARIAVESVGRSYQLRPTAAGLVSAVHQANDDIYAEGAKDRGLRGMGTTLTAAALLASDRGARIVVANVGDSRAYLFGPDGLRQLTMDHSLVEEMVRRGEITEREAFFHPNRHILTRALGVDRQLDVDTWTVDVTDGDRILLCSDGLTNECPDAEIAEILKANPDPDSAAQALVVRALEHGGNDNVTVIVASVVETAAHAGSEAPGRAATVAAPAVPTAPSAAAGASPSRVRGPRPRRGIGERLVTFWSVMFVLALAGVLGGAAGFVDWYVKASYFVGFDHNNVAIFQGRPGGFLWFKPSLVRVTSLTRGAVYQPSLPFIEAGLLEPSLSAAIGAVDTLMSEKSKLGLSASITILPATAGPGTSASLVAHTI